MFSSPYASAALFASLGASTTRAVDVLRAFPDLSAPERMGAAFLVNEFAVGRFGPEDANARLAFRLLDSVTKSSGEAYDASSAYSLEHALASLEAGRGDRSLDPSDEITQVIVRGPSLVAGPVRFYQDPYNADPVRPNAVSERGTVFGGYLATNENHFSSYFPEVAGLGGVVMGIGSFQNLDLALAAEASAVVFCDVSPLVAMTLTLLLPQLPESRDRFDFGRRALNLVNRDVGVEPFLEPIPEAYRPAFAAHVDSLRHSVDVVKSLNKLVKTGWGRADGFLGNDDLFERAAYMVGTGCASVIYGNFFGPGMTALADAALSVYAAPLRVVHLTNAPEQIVVRDYDHDETALPGVLAHPAADPDGLLLLSTEFTSSLDVRRNKRAMDDQFSYHVAPLGSAARILRAYGGLRPFINRFRDRFGLLGETG